MPTTETQVPLRVRVQFAHAAVQWVADQAGIDVLHVKGVAFDPDLQEGRGGGTDADILVRPSQVKALLEHLERRSWRRMNSFHTGSPFGHAATYAHEQWGYADIHRFFPGMGRDDEAFEALWEQRGSRDLADITCPVPSRAGQVLVLLLNGARNGHQPRSREQVAALMGADGDKVPQALTSLVVTTRAQLAYDAALGELDRHQGHPEYHLWQVTLHGGTRIEEWAARVRAAPGARAKAALVLRAPLVNRDHLRTVLGREPTRTDLVREFFDRPRRGAVQEWRRRVTPRLSGIRRGGRS